MSNSPCAAAVAEPPETRTSGLGTLFDAETLRDFLRAALRHPAVRDAVAQLGFESVVAGQSTPTRLSGKLRPLLEDALAAAGDADFLTIAYDVVAGAADALGVRPLHDLIGPSDEQVAADMQRTIYEGNQTPKSYAGGRASYATKQRAPTPVESARPRLRWPSVRSWSPS